MTQTQFWILFSTAWIGIGTIVGIVLAYNPTKNPSKESIPLKIMLIFLWPLVTLGYILFPTEK